MELVERYIGRARAELGEAAAVEEEGRRPPFEDAVRYALDLAAD
jgi:hypothetical protein